MNIKVLCIDNYLENGTITDEQYKSMQTAVRTMYQKRKEDKVNFIGVFCVMFNKQIKRKKALYCAEFVRYALNTGNIELNYLPEVIKPEDFKQIRNSKLIYKGKLKEYKNRIRCLEAPQLNTPITIIRTRAAV